MDGAIGCRRHIPSYFLADPIPLMSDIASAVVVVELEGKV